MMMRLIFALLLSALAAFGVTISDTVRLPTGATATGRLTISLVTNTSTSTQTQVGFRQVVPITSGVLNISLTANSVMIPVATIYRVDYEITNGGGFRGTEYWYVPSGGPYTIAQVRTTPNNMTALTSISNIGAAKGTLIVYTSTGWGLFAPGADGLCLTFDSTTASGLRALTCGTGGGGSGNTASNVGASGTGVYDGVVGSDLQFRKLHAASAKVSVTLNGQMLDLDIVESALTLNNIGGTLGAARGGLGANMSAFSGLVAMTGGAAYAATASDLPLHASRHTTGADPVATTTPAINSIPMTTGATVRLGAGWLPLPTSSTIGGIQSLVCGGTDKVSALNTDGTVVCSADQGGGGSSPGGASGTLQYNQAGSLGGITEFSYAAATITGNASAKLDLSAASVTAGLKIPSAAGAAPTADGFIAIDTTAHTLKFGSNGTSKTVVDTLRTISTTTPLGGGGALSGDLTLTCTTCIVNTGSYADPAWITSLAASKLTGNYVSTITGTTNQVNASASIGAVTLSLPQSIATSSTPQFGALGIGIAAGSANTLRIGGSTSGSLTIAVPAAAGTSTITFPSGTTDFSTTGGTSQFLKQAGFGAAITVAQPAFTDLSGSIAIGQTQMTARGDLLTVNSSAALARLAIGGANTVVHGGTDLSFSAVVSADLNITTTTCSNQFITALSAGAVGTCTTATLAGAQFANQGTTTTLLHGNAAGNPAWGAVVEADITLAANLTNDATTSRHGFLAMLDNDPTHCMNGQGAWTACGATGGSTIGPATNTTTGTTNTVTHNFGSADVVGRCDDNGSPANPIDALITYGTNTTVFTFSASVTSKCRVIGGSAAMPLTTKGDLFAFSTAGTRLGVTGVNGRILVEDSTAATGMAWVAPGGGTFKFTTTSEPTCNSTERGTIRMVQGGSGMADTLRVCAKNSSDVYAWTALY